MEVKRGYPNPPPPHPPNPPTPPPPPTPHPTPNPTPFRCRWSDKDGWEFPRYGCWEPPVRVGSILTLWAASPLCGFFFFFLTADQTVRTVAQYSPFYFPPDQGSGSLPLAAPPLVAVGSCSPVAGVDIPEVTAVSCVCTKCVFTLPGLLSDFLMTSFTLWSSNYSFSNGPISKTLLFFLQESFSHLDTIQIPFFPINFWFCSYSLHPMCSSDPNI